MTDGSRPGLFPTAGCSQGCCRDCHAHLAGARGGRPHPVRAFGVRFLRSHHSACGRCKDPKDAAKTPKTLLGTVVNKMFLRMFRGLTVPCPQQLCTP